MRALAISVAFAVTALVMGAGIVVGFYVGEHVTQQAICSLY